MAERRYIGNVEVDSGSLVIGDPGYFLPHAAEGKPGVDYENVIKTKRDMARLAGLPALLLSNLGGDGSFPVYGEFEGDELVAVTVEFDPPEDESDPPPENRRAT